MLRKIVLLILISICFAFVIWRVSSYIVPSFVNAYYKIQEPSRNFVELEDLNEVVGEIAEITCNGKVGIRAIALEAGISYNLVEGNDFNCEDSRSSWIGKNGRLLVFDDDSSLEVYELHVGSRRIYDYLWYKSKIQNNDAYILFIPITIIGGFLFRFWLGRRKSTDVLNSNE